MRKRRRVSTFAVLLTAQLTLAACDLIGVAPLGVAPPGMRELIIRVDNTSGMPARLFVAEDESPMGRSVGTAVPNTIPPGINQDVVFTVPSGTGWAIFVNPSPVRGALITAIDVPPDFRGATPLIISVGANGEPGVQVPAAPGWFGQ